jgi:PAP2 superfamily
MPITDAEEPPRNRRPPGPEGGRRRDSHPQRSRAAVATGAFVAGHASTDDEAIRAPLPTLASLASQLASQDWLIISFFAVELVALSFAHGAFGPARPRCIGRVAVDLALFFAMLFLVRGPVLRWGSVTSSLLYRIGIVGVILASYFQLRDVLPVVSPWADDAQIYAFDRHVFGFEPALWLDRYVGPATTEWFAFFYFLYFLILAVHVLPMLFLVGDVEIIGRFAVGLLLVFLTAHLLYMAVPGWGPYWYLGGAFHHELHGGFFWRLVREAVDAGGAQKDIFPSLHTAGPTFVAIFSFRERKALPFKYTWPVIAFFATQIIIATMFLRWHYLVDVVAGVILATTAAVLGQRIADWERAKRARLGLQPAWTPLAYVGRRAAADGTVGRGAAANKTVGGRASDA